MSDTDRPRRGVLLVGSRSGALAAAERSGRPFALLLDRAPDPDVAARVPLLRVVRFHERTAVEEAAARLAREVPLGAVLAVGENSVLPAAWARGRLGVPGHDEEVALRCTDKLAMKRAARAADLPCAPWRAVGPSAEPGELLRELGTPLVLKRSRSSGSRGLVLARDAEATRAALASCDLAEGWVEGREMSVESLVHEGRVTFWNPTEYHVPAHANVLPADLTPDLRAEVEELNARAIAALGVRQGMTHLELYRTPRGLVFGELAARPPGGRIPQLLRRAYGKRPWDAVLALELGEAPPFPARAKRCAGAWILHPGPGVVRSIRGLEEAAAVPGVCRVRCRLQVGDRVPPRLGTGQDIGYIEAEGATAAEVARALDEAHGRIEIVMLRDA